MKTRIHVIAPDKNSLRHDIPNDKAMKDGILIGRDESAERNVEILGLEEN